MSLQRKESWPEALAEFFVSRRVKPFAWGENDCCLFACDAVLAMTGTDLAEIFRGKYSTAIGAAKAIASFLGDLSDWPLAPDGPKRGFTVGDLAEDIASKFAIPGIAIGFAQRGDVVLIDLAGGTSALGIVDMRGTHAVSIGPDGPVRVPLASCRKAWRIG